ncbi:DUF1838 family protein [Nonomuraea spiralis]|uniref:DUF1838 family protein n=1 Tax=Nonomuraea spiralis TaxID=46182 RepID=A0ABV5IT66_9ACTN|nr:DUF1838 family protein [Nonomuraea spiralis]GGT16811.1 hypothetical protein GCM10010176_071670 [Nonomuraea spiralis]
MDLVRVRADLSGAEVVVSWSGDVYAWLPGDGPHHLFGFEGVNVSRAVAAEAGYRLLSREAAFYLDPATREILDTWDNRYTGDKVDVAHVWNDPVNQFWPHGLEPSTTRIGADVVINADVLLAYPSPLPVAEYPENSGDDVYRAMELFQFFARAADVDDSSVDNVGCTLSWTRVAPWLPWMRMARRPGALVYHCRGAKLPGWEAVPERIRKFVADHGPRFAHAPETWSAPNETSWTSFRKRAIHPSDDAQRPQET